MSALLKGVIRNGRVEVDEPIELPDGTGVLLTPETPGNDNGPVLPSEIASVLAAMRLLQPLDIPQTIADDLDDWERKLNQRGIDRSESGIEGVFR